MKNAFECKICGDCCYGEGGILLQEENLPFSEPVRGLEELLGLDPLYSANEGKVLMVVSAANAEATLALLGDNAAVIGEVTEEHAGKVVLNTTMNTLRTIGVLTSDPLPRIC